MSLNYAPQTVTAETYAHIFAKEQAQTYPEIDALEQRCGYALDREKLEAAARVLECPFKAAPPNWQHGRVLYSLARRYFEAQYRFPLVSDAGYTVLDIGTAKGFSALCLLWALKDSGLAGWVTSVDVLNPLARVRRNTVAEVDSLRTLPEILEPWPETQAINFVYGTSLDHLKAHRERVHAAFVDGKHDRDVVTQEAKYLASSQGSGDLVIFDDVQMPQVGKAVASAAKWYELEYLALGSVNRAYAIGVKK